MRRMFRVASVVALGLTSLLVAHPVAAEPLPVAPNTSDSVATGPEIESDFVARTNALRAERGLEHLVIDANLTAKARAWAETMSGQGRIWHSSLADGVTSDWYRLGENVGTGSTVEAIHDALVASPSHLANLLDPGFRFVGVGAVNIEGTIYVSEVFMEQASQPAPSTSAPAAGTPPFAPDVAPATELPLPRTSTSAAEPEPSPAATSEAVAHVRPLAESPRLEAAMTRLRRLEV